MLAFTRNAAALAIGAEVSCSSEGCVINQQKLLVPNTPRLGAR
ncbi:hypothetical protein V1282_003904 [Nitrobacteraceae bacterium AZCC 2146]